MKIKWNDLLEKKYSIIFGVIGILAIMVNLILKGLEWENILDAIKDIAGLAVAIAVFLIANKLLFQTKRNDFISIFEDHLKEWAYYNKYLIDTKSIENEMGKEKKRAYKMVLDHLNFVVPKSEVSVLGERDKGAFVYIPLREAMGDSKQDLEFKINSSTFSKQTDFILEGKPDLKKIISLFSVRINSEFSNLGIKAKPFGEDRIKIYLADMDRTPENAKRLVDLVEFVKTLILALA